MDQEVCNYARQLADSKIAIVLLIKIIGSLVGIVFSCVVFRKECVKWVANPNAKVIFTAHMFLTIVVAFAYLIPHGFDFYRLSKVSSNNCDYVTTTEKSFFTRLPAIFGSYLQSLTMCSFAIERFISTVCPSSYEKVKNRYLGCFLTVCGLSFATVCLYLMVIFPIRNFDGYAIISSLRTDDNYDNYTLWLFVYAGGEVLTLFLILISLLINYIWQRSTENESGHNLSRKYQIRENYNILILLLPCFLTHTILSLTPSISIALMERIDHVSNPADKAFFVECVNQMALYSLIMPSIVFLRVKFRRRASVVVNKIETAELHIQQLQDRFWVK